jgi:hypothetical protein
LGRSGILMLLIKHLLTEKEYKIALSKGVKFFLYNEINFTPQFQEGITLLNCTTERVLSTWFTWEEDDKVLTRFKNKFPQFFQWGKYDMTLAFQKALYWSNQKTGFLQYVKNRDYPNVRVLKEEGLFDSNYIKSFIKYSQSIINQRKQIDLQINEKKDKKIGIFVKDKFQVSLYKQLINNCKSKENIFFFVNDDDVINEIKELGVENKRIVFCDKYFFHKIPFINWFRLNKDERFILNQIVNNWGEVEKWTGIAKQMVANGITKALINEGENGLFGAAICEVFRNNGVVSYNTMNGMKSGQAQDSYLNFDYWFVWDKQMKNQLQEKNKLPEKMLLVSGHLMEDEVNQYVYHGTFDKIDLNNKVVISLFSVRGKREEKMDAFQYLYQLAENNPQIQLLIRKHPSEKEEDLLLPSKELENITWVEYNDSNSKETLYDQLSISDLSICFGSTVALESKWFGVPCITFEKREESLIYLTDNEMIFHVKELDQLIQKCNELLVKGKIEKPKLNKVADYIVETLLQ